MIHGPFEVTLPGMWYSWWVTALGNLLIDLEGPQASHHLHSQEAGWGPAGPHRACAPRAQPHHPGVGKAREVGAPLRWARVSGGWGFSFSATRASASDCTSRVKRISWKSSERCISHDHLSAVGVLNRLFLFTSSPNKTEPSFCRHRGAEWSPHTGEVRDAVPVTARWESHFLHHFTLLHLSEEGNSHHIFRWRVKATMLK